MAVNRMVSTPHCECTGREDQVETNVISIVPSLAGGTALQCICT